jgi:hypothetical protein
VAGGGQPKETVNALEGEGFHLAVLFEHRHEPFENFWIEVVLVEEVLDYALASQQTIDLFLLNFEHFDFSLHYFLEFLYGLEFAFEAGLFLKAGNYKVGVLVFKIVVFFFFFDDERVEGEDFLVVAHSVVGKDKFRVVFFEEMVEVTMNVEGQPAAVAIVETEQFAEDGFCSHLKKMLYYALLADCFRPEDVHVLAALDPDDQVQQYEEFVEAVDEGHFVVAEVGVLVDCSFEALTRRRRTSGAMVRAFLAKATVKSTKPVRKRMASGASSSRSSSRLRREWTRTKSSPRMYWVAVKALGMVSFR